MIVTCEACETQFQLDDAKVPEGGVRVRCSRCKHAFFIESPQRAAADEAEDLAREVLAGPTSPGAAPRSADAGLEDGESDWKFNEDTDPPEHADAGLRAAAQEAVDDLLGIPAPESPEDGSLLDSESDVAADTDPFADFGVSGADLGVSDADEPEQEFESIHGEFSDEFDDDPSAIEIDEAAAEDPSSEAAEMDVAAEPADGADVDSLSDLGSPDDWEFFAPESGPERVSRGTPIGRIRRAVPDEAAHIRAERAGRAAAQRGFEADAAVAAGSAWNRRGRQAVGWVIVSVLASSAALAGLWPALRGAPTAPVARSLAGFEVEGVEGRWIENAAVGPLYVVSGWLRAQPTRQAEVGSQLRVRLLDERGAALISESAAVGPPVREDQLREWNLPDLREFHEKRALQLAWSRFAPGERRPFQAILGDMPMAAAAFEFQGVALPRPAPRQSVPEAAPLHEDPLAAEALRRLEGSAPPQAGLGSGG